MGQKREFDLILWGATGFTGRLTAQYLARHPDTKRLRWALGGRNEAKLKTLRADLAASNAELNELPLVLGDSHSEDSMAALAARTRVVASLVGPYARYGSELLAACAEHGTHYCDITGEAHWIRQMIDAHHERAQRSGARIVNCCGFDSIPSDLGVWTLQDYALSHFGVPCDRLTYLIYGGGFGMSGGTFDSMIALAELLSEDRSIARVLADPYGLNPAGARGCAPSTDRMLPSYDRARGTWTAPFIMASINTRIVRRSNALLGHPYGRAMRYEERLPTGSGASGLLAAALTSGVLASAMPALLVRPIREGLKRFVLPKPGEGPSPEQRARASFHVHVHGRTADGSLSLKTLITGEGDPGYDETSKMVGESALCLALDSLSSEGGLLTPASAMGRPLVERLREAGQSYEVEVESASKGKLEEHTRRQQVQLLSN